MKRSPYTGRLPDTVRRFVEEAERTPPLRLEPLVPSDDDDEDVTEPPLVQLDPAD